MGAMQMNDPYKRAAEEEDALEGEVEEMAGLTGPVPARVKQNADAMYSLRFTRAEIRELREAAERQGMKLSEIIRRGALEFARRDQVPVAEEVRAKIRELAEVANRL
jgi:hypothetical protein